MDKEEKDSVVREKQQMWKVTTHMDAQGTLSTGPIPRSGRESGGQVALVVPIEVVVEMVRGDLEL